MSRLIYNEVSLQFLRTKLYGFEVVSNGPDRVGTRHTLSIEAMVHCQTVASLVPAPPVNPEAPPGMYQGEPQVGTNAISAFLAIRNRLLEKRKSLRLELAGRLVSSVNITPEAPCTIDLGPHPLACNLVAINGGQSFVVEYHIEWATPDRRCKGGPPAVLSHVWSATEELDADFYPTQTIEGRIVFDPRQIGPAGTIHPEDVRSLLLPMVPYRMMREKIHCHLNEDGCTLDYAVADRLRACVVNHHYVTRIEASHTNTLTTPGPKELSERMGAMVGVASSIGKAALNLTYGRAVGAATIKQIAGKGAGAALSGPAGWAIGGAMAIGDLASAAFQASALSYSAIVINVHSVQVTAYGHSESPYEELDKAAISIALYRLMRGSNTVLSNWGGDTSLTHSADPRSSTFTCSLKCAPRYPPGFAQSTFGGVGAKEQGWIEYLWSFVEEGAKTPIDITAQISGIPNPATAVVEFPEELWSQAGYFGVFPNNVPQTQGGGIRQGQVINALQAFANRFINQPGSSDPLLVPGLVGDTDTIENVTGLKVPTFFKLMLFRTEFGRNRNVWRDPFLTGPNFAGGLASAEGLGQRALPDTGVPREAGAAQVHPKTTLERQIVAALQQDCSSIKAERSYPAVMVDGPRKVIAGV